MRRRAVLASAAAAAVAGTLGGRSAAGARVAGGRGGRAFLFVHGAWHSAAHWGRVVTLLAETGHTALAIDLPGSGLSAALPTAFLANDAAGLQTEVSPLKDVALGDYAAAVLPTLRALARTHGAVTLVGHSFGGLTITRLAELAPECCGRLVYLSAFCPALQPGGSANAYFALPENAGSLVEALVVADPGVTGAYRINPRATDHEYVERVRAAFYHDVPPQDFLAFSSILNPDAPAKAADEDARGTVERWGRVPRTYIRCALDRAIPVALQDRMIREADELTPRNRFVVATLESSHSPFAAMPDRLAALLLQG